MCLLQEKKKKKKTYTETNSPYEMVSGNWDTRFLSANITFSGLIYLLYLYSLSFCCLLPSFRYCFNVVVVFCLSSVHCVIRQRYTIYRDAHTAYISHATPGIDYYQIKSWILLKRFNVSIMRWSAPFWLNHYAYIQYPLISIQALSSAVSVDVIFHIKLT